MTYGVFFSDYIKTMSHYIKYITLNFVGFRVPIIKIHKYYIISQVESISKNGSKYAKAEGTYAIVLDIDYSVNVALVQLPTKQRKYFSLFCFVTIGRNANLYKKYSVIGKSGFNRLKGKAAVVRGVAMNPIDHPHGGRTKTNKPEVSL